MTSTPPSRNLTINLVRRWLALLTVSKDAPPEAGDLWRPESCLIVGQALVRARTNPGTASDRLTSRGNLVRSITTHEYGHGGRNGSSHVNPQGH